MLDEPGRARLDLAVKAGTAYSIRACLLGPQDQSRQLVGVAFFSHGWNS
jgi:hypothetical protein